MIEGVIRTRVGYAGGETENPDYGNIGDHTEAVQVDYDPRVVSYEDLLAVFWKSHTPTSRSWMRQYLNAVFFHNDAQKMSGEDSKAALARKTGRTIRTPVLPLRSFTLAENYHQKYMLKRQSRLTSEMSRIYPRNQDFINSTAVSRLNGYAGGNGSVRQLALEIDSLGLSDNGKRILKGLVR
jgi:methionine-S-sulfoxide reductase